MLIICDFDGTVTARDTNSALAQRFSPDAYAGLEGKLATRELTLREVLAGEFAGMSAELEEVVACALGIPFRDGFAELLATAHISGHEVVLLSSGFRQIIEPMLEREGLLGAVPLVCNDIAFDGRGGTITWRELPTCEVCGEPCKRADVRRLRAESEHDTVVFVGDGFSDRCGADIADRIFARDSLSDWLNTQQVTWEPWDDFHDVARALQLVQEPST